MNRSIKSLIDQATAEAHRIGYRQGLVAGESKAIAGLRLLSNLNSTPVRKAMADKPTPPNALAAIAYTMHAIALDSARKGIDAKPELQALASMAGHPTSIDKFMESTGIVSKSFRRLANESIYEPHWLVRKGGGTYDESKHPRGRNGRFISKDSIHDAKSDPVLAEKLRDNVRPEDADKLEDALSGKTDLGRTKRGEAKHQTQQKREAKTNSVAEVMRITRAMQGYGDGEVDADGNVKHNITAEHLEGLAEHLPNLTVAQLKEARQRIREKLGWGRSPKHREMVQALTEWAKGEAGKVRDGKKGEEEGDGAEEGHIPDPSFARQPNEPAIDYIKRVKGGIGRVPNVADLQRAVNELDRSEESLTEAEAVTRAPKKREKGMDWKYSTAHIHRHLSNLHAVATAERGHADRVSAAKRLLESASTTDDPGAHEKEWKSVTNSGHGGITEPQHDKLAEALGIKPTGMFGNSSNVMAMDKAYAEAIRPAKDRKRLASVLADPKKYGFGLRDAKNPDVTAHVQKELYSRSGQQPSEVHEKGSIIQHNGQPHTVVAAAKPTFSRGYVDEGEQVGANSHRQHLLLRASTPAELLDHKIKALEAEHGSYSRSSDSTIDHSAELQRLRSERDAAKRKPKPKPSPTPADPDTPAHVEPMLADLKAGKPVSVEGGDGQQFTITPNKHAAGFPFYSVTRADGTKPKGLQEIKHDDERMKEWLADLKPAASTKVDSPTPADQPKAEEPSTPPVELDADPHEQAAPASKPKKQSTGRKNPPVNAPKSDDKPAEPPTPQRDAEVSKHFHDAYKKQRMFVEHRDGLVPLPRLWHEMKKRMPDLTLPEFHKHVWEQGMSDNAKAELHVLNEVHSAVDPELAINKNDRMYYYFRPKKANAPLADDAPVRLA